MEAVQQEERYKIKEEYTNKRIKNEKDRLTGEEITKSEAYGGILCDEELTYDWQMKDELLEEDCVKDELLDLSDYETCIKNIEIEEEFVGAVDQAAFKFEENPSVVMATSAEKPLLVESQIIDSPSSDATETNVSLPVKIKSTVRTLGDYSERSPKRYSINLSARSKEGDQEIFQCSECNYETRGKYQLKIHLLTHSQEQLFKCSECNFSTNWKTELKAHEAKHSKAVFSCKQCQYETNRRYLMRSHQRKHTELRFQCPQCDYKTSWKGYMKVHSLSHLEKKLFKCAHCEYGTNFKSHLKTHLLKHSDGGVLKCSDCSYTTYGKHLLKLHLLTHSSRKLYKCPDCSYHTNRTSCMRTHRLRHSDKKRFHCSQCNYKSNFRRQVRIHELRHSKQKLFHCSKCSFQTDLKTCLTFHVLSHEVPVPDALSDQWAGEATKENCVETFEKELPLKKSHGPSYEHTRWTLEDKKTILSCFEYSRFDGWGRQKGRILEEQIEKCDLPPEKKAEGSMTKICSLIPKITKFIPEEERKAIREEARRKAKEDLGTMDDERKAEIKKGIWTLEEKWALVWAAEYARRHNLAKRDYTHTWKELFSRLCPFKGNVSVNRLHTIRHNIKSKCLFSSAQTKYMEERVKHLLFYKLPPVENPIPYPSSEDLNITLPSSSSALTSSEDVNVTAPVIYLPSLPSLQNPVALILVQCPTKDSNLDLNNEDLVEVVDKK